MTASSSRATRRPLSDVGDQGQAFTGEVVDNRQYPEPAAIGEGI
jgi:hypothetical protein